MGILMLVCMSVWYVRANRDPNPRTNLNEILQTHLPLFKEGFGASLTPSSLPGWAWGPETLLAD